LSRFPPAVHTVIGRTQCRRMKGRPCKREPMSRYNRASARKPVPKERYSGSGIRNLKSVGLDSDGQVGQVLAPCSRNGILLSFHLTPC
jgi:hypothetical protein